MAKAFFRAGQGLNLKASTDVKPDGALTVCRYASFDETGAITSGRGRAKANNGNALGGSGSALGGFDGLISAFKYRFWKRGTAVYTGWINFPTTTNITAAITTSVGTLVNAVRGLTAPTWGSATYLSGFAYGGYAYLADGNAVQRISIAHADPPVPTAQTWGLVSPGYHTGASQTDPLSCNNTTTVTFTIASGHGLGLGLAASPSYPYTMNVEIVGAKTLKSSGVDVIPDNEINCLHYGGSGEAGDISVVSSGGLMSAGATYTVTYQNGAGSFDWQALNVQSPSGGAAGYSNTLQVFTTTHGSPDPATDEVQTMSFQGGSASSGFGRLKASRGGGDYEITSNIAYNATAAEFQAALEELSFFNAASAITTAVSVTSATAFTFTVPTTPTGGALTGGGSAWFIRQGPTLASATGGDLVGGKYYYAYTFYNGVAESNFSAQVPIVVATGDKVTLTNILMGPVGTTARRIYRTDVDGRQLYFIGEITDNTTLTWTDTAKLAHGADFDATPGDGVTDAEFPVNAADQQARAKGASKRSIREAQAVAKAKDEKLREKLGTNLGLQSGWTDHDPPPTDLKHVGLIGTTVFAISGSALRFSASDNPEHWPLSNSVTPGKNTSETLRAWLAFGEDCIMYTDNQIYRLASVSLDFSDARFQEIETPVGLAGEWAVAALDGQMGHIFLAKSGLYLFDGARVNEIGHHIEPLFTDSANADYINPNYMSSAVMVTSRDRMLLFYATSSSGNDRMLWCDFQDISDPKFSVFSWAHTSAWRERSDNTVLAGDSSGNVWNLDYGYADGNTGTTVDFSIESKEYALTGEECAFQVDEFVLDADLAGVTTTITITSRGRGSSKTAVFTNATTGRRRITGKCPTYMRGEVVKIALSSASDTERNVYGWGFTYLPMGDSGGSNEP